jgi:Ca2+-binding RTX toxin-like protein
MPSRMLTLALLAIAASGLLIATDAAAKRHCGPERCLKLDPGACANSRLGGGGELRGTGRGDRLLGGRRHDVLLGFAGADCLLGGGGPDRLNGGKGSDRLRGEAGADIFEGDSGADRLSGGRGRDELSGGSGSDRMLGGAGDDLLRAAEGRRDVVRCGRGHDRTVVDRVDSVRGCEVVGYPSEKPRRR